MRKKNDTAVSALMVIVGIITAAAIALCVLVTVRFRIPGLQAAAIPEAAADQTAYEAVTVTNSYDAFTLGASGQGASTEETETEESSTSDSEYLCDYSSSRQLTASDMASLNSQSYGTFPGGRSLARMMINEIYARHGYRFQDSELLSYFNEKSWYTARTSDMSAVTSQMSSTEKANIEFLQKYD